MVGCHHPLNGCVFEQALGDGEGKPGELLSMESQRVRHASVTEQQQQQGAMHFSVPSCSGSCCLHEGTALGEPCILCTSQDKPLRLSDGL